MQTNEFNNDCEDDNLDKIIESNYKRRAIYREKGKFIFNETFTNEKLEELFFDIQEASENSNIKEITIYINSYGGYVHALMPLIDLIQGIDKPVNTVVLGCAYSCAAILLLCGTGKRQAYKHSEILLHEVANYFGYEKTSQIKKDVECIDRVNKMLIKLIKENTKMTDKEIARFMDSNLDEFITATQALKFGIINKII